MTRRLSVAVLLTLGTALPLLAQERVEQNVVYGMYSGTALLMDVYRPAQPNGFGIVDIPGSGWSSRLGYGAPALKDLAAVDAPALTAAGYTVFAISHRATPGFRYPAPVEDAQRAVRFIRHNAGQYGIDSRRIGGLGGSSGAHLVSMLATLDGGGDTEDADPVNRESAKIQVVVVRATPTNLLTIFPTNASDALGLFLGETGLSAATPPTAAESKLARSASPIIYVSSDDGPFLLVHGDADRTVPFHQSEEMETAMKKMGVPAKLIRVEGGDHGPTFPGAKAPVNVAAEAVKWFNQYLRGLPPTQ